MRPVVLIAALLLAAPAQAAAPPAPAKPAAPPRPAAPAAAKVPNFDARDPASMIALMKTLNADATIAKSENGQVFLNVKTPGGGFGAQMIGCDAKGKVCQAVALFTVFDKKAVTLAQINTYNRAQMACRGVQIPDGRPSVMYSTLVNGRMPFEEARQHMGVWQGCLTSFADFTKDPDAFLAKAAPN